MIYAISNRKGKIKIGYSKHPEKRLRQLQTGCHEELKIIGVWDAPPIKEKLIHRLLGRLKNRHNGEWFKIGEIDCIDIVNRILRKCAE